MADGQQSIEAELIEIVVRRLVAEQHDQRSCEENDAGIYHLREALRALSLRDLRRPPSTDVS